MNKKKALPDDVGNFFQGESIFFRESASEAASQGLITTQEGTINHLYPGSLPSSDKRVPEHQPQSPTEDATITNEQESSNEDRHDVMIPCLHDVNLKAWQEIIENTETQNSALRLTSEERYAVEDVVNDLRRNERIKTSMNEIARLGILLLIHDYKQRRHSSLLYGVKKA